MGSVREIRRLRWRVRVGAPDRSVTRFSGMVAVTKLVERLNMIRLLDAAIGRIKVRDRGFSGGQLLVGLACAEPKPCYLVPALNLGNRVSKDIDGSGSPNSASREPPPLAAAR